MKKRIKKKHFTTSLDHAGNGDLREVAQNIDAKLGLAVHPCTTVQLLRRMFACNFKSRARPDHLIVHPCTIVQASNKVKVGILALKRCATTPMGINTHKLGFSKGSIYKAHFHRLHRVFSKFS